MARVLIPIPNLDFDPSEVAVPWQALRNAGHEVVFSTPDGQPGQADPMMISGRGLDLWGFIPGLNRLPLVGLTLRANKQAREAYAQLEQDREFQHPRSYTDLRTGDFDALVLPGGHRARGMRAYLESQTLRDFVGDFFDTGKPVGAICHGVLLAANSTSKRTGKSVLHGRKTTALPWSLERLGWLMSRIFRFWDPHYYRTYRELPGAPVGDRSVESDVKRLLASPDDFRNVPTKVADRRRKVSGRHRDSPSDDGPSFVVRDGNYVSARWPGDANTFAKTIVQVLAEQARSQASATHAAP